MITIKQLWATVRLPSVYISLGTLVLGGFIAGVLFWGGFNTVLEATNTETYCISCHEMADNVYQELQKTSHWVNPTGVRATCPDCHVPRNWTDKLVRKIKASKELWGSVFGTVDTREKFNRHRLDMARYEWKRFSANKSLECRNCHEYKSMKFSKMSEKARVQMQLAAEKNRSCLDCHKGIAHQLPDMLKAANEALAVLEQRAVGTSPVEGEIHFTVRQIPAYYDESLQDEAGKLNAATPVKVMQVAKDSFQVRINGWRKMKGFGRVVNEDFGLNISSAILDKETALNEKLVNSFETKEDDLTGLAWQRVSLDLWIAPGVLLDSLEPLWGYAGDSYRTSCSVCHSQPAENHFDTNTWPGMFSGMLSFVSMDGDTQEIVLKYLQKNSSDSSEAMH